MTSQEIKRFSAPAGKKDQIARQLKQFLERKPEVLFAFIYGSFVEGSFRDIDVGVYLDESRVLPEQQLEYQLLLTREDKLLAQLIERTWDEYFDFSRSSINILRSSHVAELASGRHQDLRDHTEMSLDLFKAHVEGIHTHKPVCLPD
ncbi:MAG: hypothetical protein A2Z21_01580 [Candidatus Fraserbacteria bacterium RBG_16_55_9]|uniref:Polymerase beta nucleotidyltransferase domain-containing protein n=1 Tax=Fraserbacteria sp. (strain RBG_16_55_9) TaxID=1817864 RepID=A0A1F5UYB7_FRAXR|nr:MAG: hypothetical protein A2Z21_01580 [Candidatus Fraserbacteria bacterium RBG_16_55_9]